MIITLLLLINIYIPQTLGDEKASQTTWIVDKQGTGDFSTIQDAINASVPGDTIMVQAGVYKENLYIHKSIILRGENKHTTIIKGNQQLDTITITAQHVYIQDFTIKGSGPSGRDAAIQLNTNQTRITNNIITNSTIGIFLHFAHENTIEHNIIYACKDYGIHLNNAHNNQFIENTIAYNRWGCLITLSYGNLFQFNSIHNNSIHGIWILRHAVENTLESNFIKDNINHGILIQLMSYNTTIKGNIIENNKCGIESGLYWPCDHTIISENTIKNHQTYGIYLRDSSESEVHKNNIINNTIPAYHIDTTQADWDQNYWGYPANNPIFIKGKRNYLPCFQIDWNPTSQPYPTPQIESQSYNFTSYPFDPISDDLPPSFNWNSVNGTNYLSPVKNQMPAPTCETYALCCTLETMVRKQVGATYDCDLSEVHLFLYSGGTNQWGVDLNEPAEYLVTHGVPDEGCFPDPHRPYDFPFESIQGWENRTVKISEWGWVDNKVQAIKQALITRGPLVICQMTRRDLDYYEGGIYMPNMLSPIQRGHVVAITGYDDVEQCFIVRNSAGESWGEQGYFRISYEAFAEYYSFIFPFYGGTGIFYINGVYGNLMPDAPKIYIETPALSTTYIQGISFPTIVTYLSPIQRGAPRIMGSLPVTVRTTDSDIVQFYLDGLLMYEDDTEPYEYTIETSPGLHTLEVVAEKNMVLSKDTRDIYILGIT